MIHVIYPENRYVSEEKVVLWAMDEMVNSRLNAGDFKDDEDGSKVAAFALGMKRPSLREAMQILDDSGAVTFGR